MRVLPMEWVRKAFDDLEQEAKEGLLSDKLRLVIPPDLGIELTEEQTSRRLGSPVPTQVHRWVSDWVAVDGD